jgi:ankyrin repeat protein
MKRLSVLGTLLSALFLCSLAYCGEFHDAARVGYVEKVKALLENGVNVDTKDDDGWTPLSVAIREYRVKVVELLLANKADPNSKNGNSEATPLHVASANGYDTFVKLLLAAKADVNTKNKAGLTPLHLAVGAITFAYFNPRTLGHEKYSANEAPWDWNEGAGHKKVVALLLEHDADTKIKDNSGKTALKIALEWKEKIKDPQFSVHKLLPELNDIILDLRSHGAKE